MDPDKLFLEQVKESTGCTEIVAIALVTSLAKNSLLGRIPPFLPHEGQNEVGGIDEFDVNNIEEIYIECDRNVFKNAKSVGIPMDNGKGKGIKLAATIGLFCNLEDLDKNVSILQIFETVNEPDIEKAKQLNKKIKIKISVKDEYKSHSNIDIFCRIAYTTPSFFGVARITGEHSYVNEIANKNGILFSRPKKELTPNENKRNYFQSLTLNKIISLSENLSEDVKKRIETGIMMNNKLVEEGLNNPWGMEIGRKLNSMIKNGKLKEDVISVTKMNASAAADARMGGKKLPAMGSAGSGNQGITASIPIITVAKWYGITDQDLINKSLAISHWVTSWITGHSAELSAMCGCTVKAGIGATAGITYLLGGKEEDIMSSINLMAANITGIICDGAKEGCSLKIANASGVAVESALYSLEGIRVPSDNGIISFSKTGTIENVGKICLNMVDVDKVLVEDIMKMD